MDKNEGINKIVIGSEDELIDVVGKIKKSKQSRILLTFTGDSSLLISPINFKVLQKIADEEEKTLVAQIFDHKAGLTNARFSGIATMDSPREIQDDLWENAREAMAKRNKERMRELKKSNISSPSVNSSTSENIKEDAVDEKPNNKESVEETSSEKEIESNDNEDNATKKTDEKPDSELQKKIDEAMDRINMSNKQKSQVVEDDDFVMSVGGDVNELSEEKLDKARGVTSEILTDKSDLKSETEPKQIQNQESEQVNRQKVAEETDRSEEIREEQTLIGQDMFTPGKSSSTSSSKSAKRNRSVTFSNLGAKLRKISASVKKGFTSLLAGISKKGTSTSSQSAQNGKKGTKKSRIVKKDKLPSKFSMSPNQKNQKPKKKFKMPKILSFINKGGRNFLIFSLVGLLVIVGIVGFFMYSIMSRVVIELFIESKPISVERTFTGEDDTEFNLDENTISVEKRTVPRERSVSRDATGTGYRGDEATGLLTLKCFKDGETLDLPKGTTLTSEDGYKFITQSSVTILCPNFTTVTVVASDVGPEYNLQSGSLFTVEGENSEEVNAVNNTAFTGGYKESYPTVAEEDIKEAVKEMKQQVFSEVEEDFKTWGDSNGWVLLKDTVNHKVEGDPEPDFPVGTETDIVNVKIETESTAIYYKREEIVEQVDKLLERKAQEENIFEGVEGVEELKDTDYSLDVSVNDGKVTAKLTARGLAKPEVNRDEIMESLVDKKWDEGIDYLKSLEFTVKDPVAEFSPEWFPKFMWNYPDSDRRIVIKVTEIEAEEVDESDSNSSDEASEGEGDN